MTIPIQAVFSNAVADSDSFPEDIQYMPPGRHRINASSAGKPVLLEIEVDAQTAETFNGFLVRRAFQGEGGGGRSSVFRLQRRGPQSLGMAVRILLGGRRPEIGRRSRLPGSGIIERVHSIPSIVELNWGEATELPFLEVEFVRPEKDRAIAERDKLLFQEMGLPVSRQWLYDRHKVPAPDPKEDLFQARVASPAGRAVAPGDEGGSHQPSQAKQSCPCCEALSSSSEQSTGQPINGRSDGVRQYVDGQRVSVGSAGETEAGALRAMRDQTTAEFAERKRQAKLEFEQLKKEADANGEVLVWDATIDERTTSYCSTMHGRAYGDGWTEPPPAHYNCRSKIKRVPKAQQ